jgi:hypothetical protein
MAYDHEKAARAIALVRAHDASAQAAEITALRARVAGLEGALTIPPEIAEVVLKIGRGEWGATDPLDAEGHAEHVAKSVRITAENFAQEGPQQMHGCYAKGTETVICHTGTSPNSPTIARALTGAWNWLHDQAAALSPSAAQEARDAEADR